MNNDSSTNIMRHRSRVYSKMMFVIRELTKRAHSHDNSCFGVEEAPILDEILPEINNTDTIDPSSETFNQDRYDYLMRRKELVDALHFKENDHHPEHFESSICGMNVIQLTEMVCDWIAKSKEQGTDIWNDLKIYKEKYSISEDLYNILINSVEYLLDKGV